MRRYGHYIIILLLLLGIVNANAQNRDNLIAAKGNLILLINLNSSNKELDSILKRAGITAKTQEILNGDFSALKKDGWVMVKRQGNVVQFNRPLSEIKANAPGNPYVITTGFIKYGTRHGYMDNAVYGINKFSNVSVYELPNGFTRFILPGYLLARRVFLSGSFNDWSTLKGLMTKAATGWAIDIKLEPGAYMYKFIADGRWLDDPNNLLQLNDGEGNVNSVYYKYNHTFKLAGYPSANRIALAGSFNNWNANDLFMDKKGNTWECHLYLREGMYAYRFMVDGHWIADPANPNKYKDDEGNINSILNIGETVYFKLNGYANAENVYVAGDFNKWKRDNISLKRSGDTWTVPVILPAGNYSYKFIVDGEWVLDPQNECRAVYNGKVNSFLAVKSNHAFKLKGYTNAKTVRLSGSFNDWSHDGYTMAHSGDEWSISLHLKPGKYLYKFIVDGEWILDPGNKLWEQNQYNTGNSVLWMEP